MKILVREDNFGATLRVNEWIAKIKGLTSKFASQDLPAFPKSAEDPDSSWVSWDLRAQGRLCLVLAQILHVLDNPQGLRICWK